MPFIKTIEIEEAQGLLKKEYEAAERRAGKVFNVVRIQSPRPKVLRQSTALYRSIMFAESALSRPERELVATVVSAINQCHY